MQSPPNTLLENRRLFLKELGHFVCTDRCNKNRSLVNAFHLPTPSKRLIARWEHLGFGNPCETIKGSHQFTNFWQASETAYNYVTCCGWWKLKYFLSAQFRPQLYKPRSLEVSNRNDFDFYSTVIFQVSKPRNCRCFNLSLSCFGPARPSVGSQRRKQEAFCNPVIFFLHNEEFKSLSNNLNRAIS